MIKSNECNRDTGRELTSLPVSRDTKEKLKIHGEMGQTWDRVLSNVIVDLERLQAGCCVPKDQTVPMFIDTGLHKPVEIGTCKLFTQKGTGGEIKILGRIEIRDEYKELVTDGISRYICTEQAKK